MTSQAIDHSLDLKREDEAKRDKAANGIEAVAASAKPTTIHSTNRNSIVSNTAANDNKHFAINTAASLSQRQTDTSLQSERSKRIRFKSLLAPTTVINTNNDQQQKPSSSQNDQELIDITNSNANLVDFNYCDTVTGTISNENIRRNKTSKQLQRRTSFSETNSTTIDSATAFAATENSDSDCSEANYYNTSFEDTKNLLSGETKYRSPSNINSSKKRATRKLSTGRTFRGNYKFSRVNIVMALLRKSLTFLTQRSTLALFGAFLIHVTLGTVYTLSNINSYLTSYMRKHGTPSATYGGSMWISSSYAVGQGLSMVLGGFIQKRFSARVSCFLGCTLHSMSIMCTSYTINWGQLAVLLSYGFLPGFGCGLSYMTPMSNGFGWFPNRKGLVAGVILAGFGIGTFVFNMAQTAYVNPQNLSPLENEGGYFTQESILKNVPGLFVFLGSIYASMQFVGCCLLFKPPLGGGQGALGKLETDERPILVEAEMPLKDAIRRREFVVLFLVFGITNQGVLFVNSMLKEYGQIFIGNDMYLAWTGSMASIANSMGRLIWGMAIDRFSFTFCFTAITSIFGCLMFLMPFEFILSSKLLYLLCTLGLFGSFSGWMSTYPVHISRVFGLTNSGIIYGLIFVSQAIGGVFTALGSHYLIDHYSRFVPFFCVALLEVLGLSIYHLFYRK